MHHFIGNLHTGSWWYVDRTGQVVFMTPKQVADNPEIVWREADGSGDFLWPHIPDQGQLQELSYEDA